MTNNIFSFRRFGIYLRLFAVENWKKILNTALSMIAFLILSLTLVPLIKGCYNHPSWGLDTDPMWITETAILWITLFVFVMTYASLTFMTCASRNRRIATLAFPASDLEKFLTYILFSVVGVYAVFFIGAVIADWTRVWTASLYANSEATVRHLPFYYFLTFGDKETSLDTISGISVCIGSLIIMQAFFTLSSAIWPMKARVKGILSATAIIMILNALFFTSFRIFLTHYPIRTRFEIQDVSFETGLTVYWAITVLLTIGMYMLSYRRFKEMETIERW